VGIVTAAGRRHAAYHRAVRAAELRQLRTWFPAGARALDVGAASGHEARLLADWGCRVTAIDLPGRPVDRSAMSFPVVDYDGSSMPIRSSAVDVAFTAHVLEHVADLAHLLAEIRRVLAPSGRAVHVVPSRAWRTWAALAHYPSLALRLGSAVGLPDVQPHQRSVAAGLRARGWVDSARRALVPPGHDPGRTCWAEWLAYGRTGWERVFRAAGFRIVWSGGLGIFYVGCALLVGLPLRARRALAAILGSSSWAYVTTPAG
jgi:SAM-dependent methyltransferase